MGNLSWMYCFVRGTRQKAKFEELASLEALVNDETMQSL